MHSSHPHDGDVPLDVALLVETEVLRRGIASLLQQIPRVTLVEPPHAFPARPENPADRARVVIASLAEWRRLPSQDPASAGSRPLVVLIGDDIHGGDLALPAGPPCDGVISLAEATVPVLDSALRRAVNGEMPLPARLARELLTGTRAQPHHPGDGRPVSFTQREKETLGLLTQGYSNKQIAKALGISAHGVKRLVGAILLKLGAPNRTTAAVMAMNQHLI
ncbi:helix-turn-helix transcriptional regulator [Streptomyces otsuchiensis]|uniref:helix-turn-helix transcriptional regulator n=1 Tax=Streptomyces otsuchiensis TaxID=2681388 RepID=UPI001031D8F0|nr:response regulator transcription factor [Streptomyces otsuchiensis]